MNTKRLVCLVLVINGLIVGPASLHAQHYPAGSEGIKAASLPSPGIYLKDYNAFYYADQIPGFNGEFESGKGFDTFTYTQAPRLLWMTDWKLFAANYGVGLRIPFVYKTATAKVPVIPPGGFPAGSLSKTESHFGLGDIEMEPVILSWHLKQFDIVGGYSIWAPTGDFDKGRFFLVNLGNGNWTHMFTFGATWYPDEEKTWALSFLNRYEINTVQYSGLYGTGVRRDTTPGDDYTLEWAFSKAITKTVDIGIVGYYQQQVTDTQGPTFMTQKFHIAGVGPEANVMYEKWGLSGSLRYAYEFSASEHPQGHTIALTLTKSF